MNIGQKKLLIPAIAGILMFSLVSFSENFDSIFAEGFLVIEQKSIEEQIVSFSNDVDITLASTSGKGKKPAVNDFLFYPDEDSTKIPAPGASTYDLKIRFKANTDPSTFSILVNGVEQKGAFGSFSAGETVTGTLTDLDTNGRNSVKVSIDGNEGGKVQTDVDRLTIITK